ncbi:MAG: acetate--CoA ligase [Aigarchaeota archaeon]|nr:acetate--CoA ligase [Aigarchaeota archaeon]MDW8092418.1 acetate--CoA ligase [Nitrososphaerota archaeon]
MVGPEVLGEQLPFEERITLDNWAHRNISIDAYKEIHRLSLKDNERFWLSIARELDWFTPPTKILEGGDHPHVYKWFADGLLNLSYLCVDRHVRTWRRNKVAMYWEGEPVDQKNRPLETRTITYGDLHSNVNRIAYAMKHELNLKKGDRIAVYMPMVPELPMTLLAAARIGVTFTVIFSGFSPEALASRISDMRAKVVFTADGGYRRGRVVDLIGNIKRSVHIYDDWDGVVVLERLRDNQNSDYGIEGSVTFRELLDKVPVNAYVEPERLESTWPLYVLYTSGTTGKPKGIIHDNGGYAVIVHANMKWLFDLRDDDVYWCTGDIGWATGHSYVLFGPPMMGATMVMYEGALDHPSPERWWEIIERYRVSVFFTAPTAVRTLMKYGDEPVKRHDLSSLRIMHTIGEPINPSAWRWFFNVVGGSRCPVGSVWGMTETGGILICHTPGSYLIPMKPGTNGLPMLGIDADVVDENGNSVPPGMKGYLVIKRPFPGMPGPPTGMLNDPENYFSIYFKRFGVFYTGDYAVKDADGYIWVLGRADEVLKVAGHRLGTYELESCLVSHPAVAEASVVGVPDELKGEVPAVFVVLKEGYQKSRELKSELKSWIGDNFGRIAEPKYVFLVSKLPKTRSGKIMRRLIKAVLLRRELGDVSTLEDEAAVEEIREAYSSLIEEIER